MSKLLSSICLTTVAFLSLPGHAHAQLLEGDQGGGSGYVNEYTLSGQPITTPLARTDGDTAGIAVDGNDLFTADSYSGTIGEYNLTTGQPIASSYISLPFAGSQGLAAANNILYVTNNGTLYAFDISGAPTALFTVTNLGDSGGVAVSNGDVYVITSSNNVSNISEYNGQTGALISPTLVSGLTTAAGITAVGNDLYTVGGGNVSEFTTSGQTVNSDLVSGIPEGGSGIAVAGNMLYVVDDFQIQEYNATSGAYIRTINSGIEQGSSVLALVPEPSSAILLLLSLVPLAAFIRRQRTNRKSNA